MVLLVTSASGANGSGYGKLKLYCVAQDEVVAFDFATGKSLGPVVRLPGLNGQAVIFFG